MKKYRRNHILYKEGDATNYLYFIKEGEIEVRDLLCFGRMVMGIVVDVGLGGFSDLNE